MLSEISEDQFFTDILPNPQSWLRIVKDICARHGIAASETKAFADGVNLVASVNDQFVVKIFPPFHRHQWESDHRTLKQLQGRLKLPIPKYLGSGELENSWAYLLMTKVEGISLGTVWRTLSHQNKTNILYAIGQTMAETHAVPIGDLASLKPNWGEFITNQAKVARNRHEKKGMPKHLLEQLDAWVSAALPLLDNANTRVILTGEYTPFNLLVSQSGDDYHLSSMIDFGDSMIGFPEYDLLGPVTFLCLGNPDLITALLKGYGYQFADDKAKIQSRLMLLLILHRYSDLNSQLRIDNWSAQAKDFDQLAKLIFPL